MRTIVLAAVALLVGCSTSSTGAASNPAGDAGSSTPTGTDSAAIASRCLEGGAGDTKDGWVRTIGADSVSAINGNVGVAIAYSLTIDDELRAAPHFAEGVWDRLLGADYTVSGARTAGGDDFGQIAFASATAVEKASGTTLFMMVVADRDNGTAFPTIALAPDEATLKAKLATPDAVNAMRAYNAFPLSCSSVVGKWTTATVNAVQTYSSSGAYTGIQVSSLQIDASFDTSGQYTWHANVTDNSGSVSENEQGSYTSDEQAIDLSSTDGKSTSYDAAFVAVKGGIALSITNRQFSGNRWVMYRAK